MSTPTLDHSHIPHPHSVAAGELPKPGQWATYLDDDNVLWPALIVSVGESSPDGNYCNVRAAKLVAGEIIQGEWLFRLADARILYIPNGPPWP